MSNHNIFWGKRFGANSTSKGNYLVVRGFGSPSSNSGKKKTTLATKQSIQDKADYQAFLTKNGGPRVIVHRWTQW